MNILNLVLIVYKYIKRPSLTNKVALPSAYQSRHVMEPLELRFKFQTETYGVLDEFSLTQSF